ncbi:MAG: lipopolysaccharide biosynthesis protein [Treponema sp.]|jgi:uncharacterized protein involved in exopolysaccharide biosynthesis|nr:lipopolysaccharide biosynthesis protein [Treponema sp.]
MAQKFNDTAPVPSQETDDDEISLIDLFAVLWHRRIMIIVITLVAAAGVAMFSILSLVLPSDISPLPNEYTPKALMLINNTGSSSGGVSAMINASGLGGLASLAGVSSTGSTVSELAIYMLGTNSFLDQVVDTFDLLTRYKIVVEGKEPPKSPRADSRKILKKKLVGESDEKSGILTVSFTDTDPEFAQTVANYCMHELEQSFTEMGLDKNRLEKENLEINIENTFRQIQSFERQSQELAFSVRDNGTGIIPAITMELNRIEMELGIQKEVYTQLRVQYELLKVSMASERPVFQVVELAEVPDLKSGPSRGIICIIVTLAAGFFAVFLAFVMNAIANIRKDPEAMAKLRGVPFEHATGTTKNFN